MEARSTFPRDALEPRPQRQPCRISRQEWMKTTMIWQCRILLSDSVLRWKPQKGISPSSPWCFSYFPAPSRHSCLLDPLATISFRFLSTMTAIPPCAVSPTRQPLVQLDLEANSKNSKNAITESGPPTVAISSIQPVTAKRA